MASSSPASDLPDRFRGVASLECAASPLRFRAAEARPGNREQSARITYAVEPKSGARTRRNSKRFARNQSAVPVALSRALRAVYLLLVGLVSINPLQGTSAETVLYEETFSGFEAGTKPSGFTAVRPLGANRGAEEPIPADINANGACGTLIVGSASTPVPSIGERSLRLYDYADGEDSSARANLEHIFAESITGLLRFDLVFRRSVSMTPTHDQAALIVSLGAPEEGQTLNTFLARPVEIRLFNDGTLRVVGTGVSAFIPFDVGDTIGTHALSIVANDGNAPLPYETPSGESRMLAPMTFDVFLNGEAIDLDRGFRTDGNGDPVVSQLGKFGLLTGNAMVRAGIDFVIDSISVSALPVAVEPIVAPMWLAFVEAKNSDEISVLPDFSYAGYHYSEKEIPRREDLPVFNVTDFGAQPDDENFDDAGIQAAIDAAEAAGGGIVFFPPGRFQVSPVAEVGNDVTEGIRISSSNIVLRGSGAGDGGTEVFMVERKEDIAGFMFLAKPPATGGPTLAQITQPAPRGAYQVEVNNASSVQPGMRVLIAYTGTDIVEDYFAPLPPPPPEWERLHDPGLNVREIHTVAAVEGNTVTFGEPLHFPINPVGQTFSLREFRFIEEVGIENIRFRGNWDSSPEEFEHHKNTFHDYAWNAVRFDNVVNGWIQNCEFRHWNQGVYFDSCAAVTVRDVTFTGKRGHMSIHTRRGYGILVHDCEDKAGQFHGPGLGYSGAGTVYLRHKMQVDQRIDSHSGTPYVSLFDDVTGGILDGNGGPLVSYPHHGRDFIFWNFSHRATSSRNYNFWSVEQRNGHTFALPSFAGFTADNAVTFVDESAKVAANESFGRRVRPASLFQAQLQYRLGRMLVEAGPSGAMDSSDGEVGLWATIEDLGLPPEHDISFSWQVLNSPGPAHLFAADTLAPTLAMARPGFYRVRIEATAGEFRAWVDVRIEATGLTEPEPGSYAAWREDHFSGADFFDEDISGPTALSPEQNRPNFYFYAFGLPPGSSRNGSPVALVRKEGTDRFGLRFLRPAGSQDVEYALERSTDLEEWTPVDSDWQIEPGENPTLEEVQVFPTDSPFADERGFLRLRLSWGGISASSF